MAITADMITNVSRFYVALFGRAPDGAPLAAPSQDGLSYWTQSLSNGTDLPTVANQMFATTEARAYYPGYYTNEQIANSFYINVLGRTPDAAGLAYWTAALNTAPNVGTVLYQMVVATTSYVAGSNPDPAVDAAALSAQALFNNRVTVAEYYGTHAGNIAGATAVLTGVTSDTATRDAAIYAIDHPVVAGLTLPLTTGPESLTGGAGADTFNASTTSNSWSAFDSVDGGGANDVMNVLTSATADPGGVVVKNIETLNISATGAGYTTDTTGYTGLTSLTLNDVANGNIGITAAATTAVNASGLTGTMTVAGGLSQTTTNAGGAVTLSGSVGAIGATVTALGAAAVLINGGTSVNVTATGATGAAANTITVGTTSAPTGAVTVAETVSLTGDNAPGAANTGGAITVKGGTTVSVTQTATNNVAVITTTGNNTTAIESAVTVTGTATTTGVTVNQSAAVVQVNTIAAIAGTKEVGTMTGTGGLTAGQTYTLAGLTFTSAGVTTQAQLLTAFANLADGAIGGNASGLNLGTYSGALTGFSSGAVASSVVTFTATTAAAAAFVATETDIASAATVAVGTAGGAATAAQTGVAGLTNGAVTINDVNRASLTAAGTITSVSLNNFGAATANSGALSSVTLAGTGTSFTETAGALTTPTVTTMTLNLNGGTTSGAVTLDSDHTTVNVVSGTAANVLTTGLTAAGATTVAISGDKALTIGTLTAGAATAVNLSNSAGLVKISAHDFAAAAVITSSGAGDVTITGALEVANRYTGSTGVDTISIMAGGTKAISTGGGNDVVTYGGALGTGGSIDAGEETDTISMTAAAAATATLTSTFAGTVSGFEVLSIGSAAATTINMVNADGMNSVTSAGGTGTLDINNVAPNFTLTQTATNSAAQSIALLTGTSTDTVNLTYSGANGYAVAGGSGTTISGVETLNIATVDSDTNANTAVYTSTIVDTAAKTVVISGAVGVNLTLASTALTSFDASGVTGTGSAGAVTYTTAALDAAATLTGGAGTNIISAALSTKAVTITGGAGLDQLTGGSGADVINGGNGGTYNSGLVGGAGADTITGGTGVDLITGGTGVDVMTGGGGNDIFLLSGSSTDTGVVDASRVSYTGGVVAPGTSLSTYGMDKIMDFNAGDTILTGAASSATAGVNATGLAWTATQGFLLGTYTAATDTFTFSLTGTDSLYVFDNDGAAGGVDLYGIVLVGYVDAGTLDTMTSGLIGVA